MNPHRSIVLVGVIVLLVAGGLADRTRPPSQSLPSAVARRAVMPSAAPAGALSSTWFCVGATATAGSPADGVITVANPTAKPASGTVTVVPVAGETGRVPLAVPPMGVVSVALHDVSPSPYAAALVDLDAGQVAAELVVFGPAESDTTPCSSRASDRWFFADGVTAKDATLHLSLFNPFPEDAIVDLSFSTDQGRAAPSAFRPVVVPARTLVVRDIGEPVRRREAISTEVAVRTGRVVAAQTQTRTGAGKAGVSTALGAPSLGSAWHFPGGLVADGAAERYAVFNPGAAEATVLFQTILDEGVAEDFERTVPANGRLDVVLNEEVGVPRGVGHSTTVRSLDGVRVVVARAMEVAAPGPSTGRADTLGARRATTRWLFPAGGTSEAVDEWVIVANPGGTEASVSVAGLIGGAVTPIEGLQDVALGNGRRRAFRIRDHVSQNPMPLLVTSSRPVVVERALYQASPSAVWSAIGIPLA